MNVKNITAAVGKTAHKLGFWTRRKSPELLVATGILTAAGAIILTVKATLKVEPIVKKANDDIKKIKADMQDNNLIANNQYSVADGKKDLTKRYLKTGLELTKLYSPAILLYSVSVASILGSHKILKGRNVALAAAYTTLENGYKSYRNRVAKKIGEEAEKNIFRNVYDEEIEVIETDKKGNEKTVVKSIKSPHLDPDADYAYLFDASNPEFLKNMKMNIDFLLLKEKYLNQKLVCQGYLFLYDVFDALGIEASMIGPKKLQASKILGWIYDPEDPTRDSYVSFGLADRQGNLSKETMDLIRNNERGIYLEFNPDGDILTGNNNTKTFMSYAKGL